MEDADYGCTLGIKGWLKTLRLHKYVSVFENLSYQGMATMTDAQLAERGQKTTLRLSLNVLVDVRPTPH